MLNRKTRNPGDTHFLVLVARSFSWFAICSIAGHQSVFPQHKACGFRARRRRLRLRDGRGRAEGIPDRVEPRAELAMLLLMLSALPRSHGISPRRVLARQPVEFCNSVSTERPSRTAREKERPQPTRWPSQDADMLIAELDGQTTSVSRGRLVLNSPACMLRGPCIARHQFSFWLCLGGTCRRSACRLSVSSDFRAE
ncbi:hypothetical protein ACVMIH_007419 [Bradyrhizobium sp. USDA 4503]